MREAGRRKAVTLRNYIYLCGLLLAFVSAVSASQIHVNIDDPVYLFLDRLTTAGFLPGNLNDTRPFTRDKVAGLLLMIHEKRAELNRIDRAILDEYLADYRMEISPSQKHFQIPEAENHFFFFGSFKNMKTGFRNVAKWEDNREKQHLFVYEKEDEVVWVDWSEALRLESKNGSYRPLNRDAIHLSAQLGEHFSAYFDGIRYVQYNVNNYTEMTEDYKGGFFQKPKEETVDLQGFDYSNAYIQVSGKYGLFGMGSEPLYWGNSPNSLILSDNVTPFPFFSWQKSFKQAQFTFFHGSLLPKEFERDSTGEKIFCKKYLVGHRWEMTIGEKLNVGFCELYIYGNRDMELAYLIPPIMLWPTQHNLMDRDNATMAVEVEYLPATRFKFYGTLFLDELTTTRIFDDYWANKQGIQLGIHYAPWRVPTDFRLEFTAVHPWTYTHKYFYNSYTHNGVDLGFYAGPNSQLWFFENQWWLSKRLYATLRYRCLKHGVEPLPEDHPDYFPIGSSSSQNYNNRNEALDHNTTWLMGDIETTNEYQLLVSYHLRKELFLDWGYKIRAVDGTANRYFSFQIRFDY